MDSLIKWTRKDRSRLDSAMKRFNREVNKLSELNIPTPEKKKFSDLVEHITTRKELDNVIQTLNDFNEITATEEVKLQSGESVPLYLYNEVSKKKEQAERNLYIELNKIQMQRLENQNKYMGEERITEIQDTLETIMDYTKDIDTFTKTASRTKSIGRTDYAFARQLQFRENFMKALDNVKNFDNYKVLKKELNKYRNPEKFYNYVKKSNVLMDIWIWYKEKENGATYSSFDSNENAFNYALTDELGIENIEID